MTSTRDDQFPKVGLVVRDDTDSNMLKLLNAKVDNLETKQQELMSEIEAMKTKARNDASGGQYPHEKCVVLYNFPRTANEDITEVIKDLLVTELLITRAEVVRTKIISHERSKR